MSIVRVYLHVLLWYGLPLLALGLIVLTIIDGARFLTKKMDAARPDHWPMAIAGICIGSVIALGVGSIPLFDRDGPSLDSDWLRGMGLVAILMIPAVLAIVGLRRRGALLTAGVVSLPMPFMSFSFLLFPMLIPAAFYLVAYDRARISYTPRIPAPVVASLTFFLLVLAFLSLFLTEDERCYEVVRLRDGTRVQRTVDSRWSSPSDGRLVESGCSSDSVTPIEAGLSLGLVTVAGMSAAYLSGPRRPTHGVLDVYA